MYILFIIRILNLSTHILYVERQRMEAAPKQQNLTHANT